MSQEQLCSLFLASDSDWVLVLAFPSDQLSLGFISWINRLLPKLLLVMTLILAI